jgi:hypothetical protein
MILYAFQQKCIISRFFQTIFIDSANSSLSCQCLAGKRIHIAGLGEDGEGTAVASGGAADHRVVVYSTDDSGTAADHRVVVYSTDDSGTAADHRVVGLQHR